MRKRWFVASVCVFFGVCVAGLLIVYFYCSPSSSRARSEQYAVYSAYIDAGLTGESHSLGSTRGVTVILNETATFNPSIPNRVAMLQGALFSFTGMERFKTDTSFATRYNFLVSNLSSEPLGRDFAISGRYVFASRDDIANWFSPETNRRFEGNYGYLMFSRVGFNRSLSEAVFYMEHMCGLCGGGRFVLMRKGAGRWVVIREEWTWIS